MLLVWLCGCTSQIVDYTGTITGSLALSTLEREADTETQTTNHSVADCPDGGWIEQADGHQVRCPDCETVGRTRVIKRRRR